MKLNETLKLDASRLGQRKPRTVHFIRLWWTSASFRAVLLMRIAHLLPGGLGRVVSNYNLSITGADIDPRAVIGPGVLLQHPVGVVIGGGCILGAGVTLMSNVVLGRRLSDSPSSADGYPLLEDEVVLGTGAVVLGKVRVAKGAVIGAQSLVLADVPAAATAIGSPAVVIRDKSSDK